MKDIEYKNYYSASTNSVTVVALMLAFLFAPLAHAQSSNLIKNPGFETDLSSWDQVEPVDITSEFRTGRKSLHTTGQDSYVSQLITVAPNTDYVFETYIKGYGRIGVLIGEEQINNRPDEAEDRTEKRIHDAEDWTKATIEFNSGSATKIEAYADFYREKGHYDDFSFAAKNSIAQSASSLLTQCPGKGYLPIDSAFDNGQNDGNSPNNVIDGNLTNRWSSKGIGKTLTLDIGQIAEVSQLDVMWYKSNERINLFSVETSSNGQSWSTALPDASSSLVNGYDSYDIENLLNPDAKLIRIVGGGNSVNEWNSIIEVRIKGCVN